MLFLAAKVYIQEKDAENKETAEIVIDDKGDDSGATKSDKQTSRSLDCDINDDRPSKKLKTNFETHTQMKSEDVIISPEFDRTHISRIQPSSIDHLIKVFTIQVDSEDAYPGNIWKDQRGSGKGGVLCTESSGRSSSSRTFESMCSSSSRTFEISDSSESWQCISSDVTVEKFTNAILQQNVIKLITENFLKSLKRWSVKMFWNGFILFYFY